MRKQHGHIEVALRRSFRFLRRADDTNQDQASEEPDVRRVQRDLQTLFRSLGRSSEDKFDQGDSRNIAAFLELDTSGVHL